MLPLMRFFHITLGGRKSFGTFSQAAENGVVTLFGSTLPDGIAIGMVDTIFADVAQPDQARIVTHNANFFLKNGGHVVISIKANCIDSTAEPEAVFAGEIQKLKNERVKPIEQVTLEPYERDHAVVVGIYRPPLKRKSEG